MPRIKLILNPTADHGHAANAENTLKQIVSELAAAAASEKQMEPFDLHWVKTTEPLHAVTLASQAADEGFDIVVALGGDGTVHEVVNGLMAIDAERRPKLAVVPMGSGNDFAHNLGLPYEPQEALRCIVSGISHPVDVGLISDGSGRREFWNNTIGIGFSGAVNITTRKITRLRGFMIYFVAVLDTIFFKPSGMTAHLSIDGGEMFEDHISMLSLCNGEREGGGFPVGPGALMDDGLITYTIMKEMGRLRLLRFLPVVMAGKHYRYQRYFTGGTATQFRIETDSTMPIHTDGEVFGSWEDDVRSLDVKIIPGALQVMWLA